MADPFFITGAPPFPFGSIARKGRGTILLYTGVDPLNLGSHEGKAYLLQLSAFDAGVVKTFAPPFPFGSISRRAPRRFRSHECVLMHCGVYITPYVRAGSSHTNKSQC